MSNRIAVIGAGIIGITNAVVLLEQGFDVTVYSKDLPLKTNSDAAVATWYIPEDTSPILQELCIRTFSKFEELYNIIDSGIEKISMFYYFKDRQDFFQSVWSKESLKDILHLSHEPPCSAPKSKKFPEVVTAQVPLINVGIYRKYLLTKFIELGGMLEIKQIKQFDELFEDYDIIINCSGWETKLLVDESETYPVRGQIEITNITQDMKEMHSINIRDSHSYMVFRPLSNDCVLGTTFQINDTELMPRSKDKDDIIAHLKELYPELKVTNTQARVGIRCGRADVCIKSEKLHGVNGTETLLVHCYGHGGSGFSASWGSAEEVLKFCLEHRS